MAGAGYKLFNTGDVLTAQQVNEYLQQQTIMVFADAAARTTALSGVLAEGMFSYLKSDKRLYEYTGTAWVTVDLPSQTGNSGKYLTTDGTNPSWGTVSTGMTWTTRLNSAASAFHQIAYNGSNLWVAVGSSGQLFTSTNGTTWTSRTSGFGANQILDVAFGNGLWVAVGANGTITTSTDGTTWTARTANMGTNIIYAVIYANATWVAVGEGGGATNTGGITYSTDGLTWTRKSQTLTVGTTYQCISWNGSNFIVGATLSTNNYLYASTAAGTWTAGVAGGGTNQITALYWDGTRNVGYSPGSFWFYSTSATLGTVTAYANGNQLASLSSTTRHISNSKLYNGSIFTNANIWVGEFIPTTATTVQMKSLIGPTPLANAQAPNGVPDANPSALWVGASGYIAASTTGQIVTSF